MLLDYPPNSAKYYHFAFAADPKQVSELMAIPDDAPINGFCDAWAPVAAQRWVDLPAVTVDPDLVFPFELGDAEQAALRKPVHPWLADSLRPLPDRHATLVRLNAPAVIVQGAIDRMRWELSNLVLFHERPVDALAEWMWGDTLLLCLRSQNFGLGDWFSCSNPVTRALAGESVDTNSELHPPRAIPGLDHHSHWPVFTGTGDELIRLAERLETEPAQSGPSKEAIEATGDPSVLRIVAAMSDAELQRSATGYDRERARYAANCRRLAASGMALLSWIGIND